MRLQLKIKGESTSCFYLQEFLAPLLLALPLAGRQHGLGPGGRQDGRRRRTAVQILIHLASTLHKHNLLAGFTSRQGRDPMQLPHAHIVPTVVDQRY